MVEEAVVEDGERQPENKEEKRKTKSKSNFDYDVAFLGDINSIAKVNGFTEISPYERTKGGMAWHRRFWE